MVEEAVAELGKEAFDELPDTEKQIFHLFIWAGCGCHKDLNTVQGGYLAMLAWWIENESEEVVWPVLLANCDNDPVVKERAAALEPGKVPTAAQEWAFHKSTCGAVKTAEIAGVFSITRMTKKVIMTFFTLGGGNMSVFHSHFLIHWTINFDPTVMQLLHLSLMVKSLNSF